MANTKQNIQQALLDLMREKKFEKIKVTEIIAKAGISRSTFYTYYDSIFEIVQEIEDEFISHFASESEVDIEANRAVMKENFSYFRDNIEVFDILSGENGDPYFNVRLASRLQRVFYKIAQEHHCALSETQIAVVCEFSKAGKLQVFHWWHDHKDEVSVREIIDILIRLEYAVDSLMTPQK